MKGSSGSTRTDVIVFAVIILAALVIGLLVLSAVGSRRPRRGRRPKLHCMSNLKQNGIAFKQYTMDYDEWFPSFGDPKKGAVALSPLYPNYQPGLGTFDCPSLIKKGHLRTTWNPVTGLLSNVSYAYRSGLNESCDPSTTVMCDFPAGIPLGLTASHGEDGGNVLYLDGHAEWVRSDDWLAETALWDLRH